MTSKKVKPCGKCGGAERYERHGRLGACKACSKVSQEKYNEANKDRLKGRHKKDLANYYKRRQENMANEEWRVNHLIGCAKNRAKKKGRDFDLTFEEVWGLWKKQGARCAISGRLFDLEYADSGPNPDGPSLDRIDSEKGYTLDNIRFVTYQVNTALSCFGEQSLIQLCKDIMENN